MYINSPLSADQYRDLVLTLGEYRGSIFIQQYNRCLYFILGDVGISSITSVHCNYQLQMGFRK